MDSQLRKQSNIEAAKIEVRVHPRSRITTVGLAEDGTLRVSVTAPPEKGKANQAVISLLAARLGLPKRSVRILRGHTGRRKMLLVEGLTIEDVLGRLASNP